jgi:predicted translin family RNA/ssDNA-binding protein
MINKTAFAALKEDMNSYDAKREQVIKGSRDVLKQSKRAIFALHRGEVESAQALLKESATQLCVLFGQAQGKLRYGGALGEACEEYTEAELYLAFKTKKEFPTIKDLGVLSEEYVAGLCDLAGELQRTGVHAALEKNYELVERCRQGVASLYGQLMELDFRNGSLRRKFDSVKYSVDKLEDLSLQVQLRQ